MGLLFSGAVLVVSTACPGLDVANPNEPDQRTALASPEDVASLAVSSVNRMYLASTNYDPWIMLSTTADQVTSNFGNFGMRFNNLQPRIAYENSSAGGDQWSARWPWQEFYGAMGAASDALRALDGGVVIPVTATWPGGTPQVRHIAQFTQAFALAQLAMLFDRAFIVDENTDLTGPLPDLSTYPEVATVALSKLDALIAGTAAATNAYDVGVFPVFGGLTSQRINRMANTMAAITLRYTARMPNDANWALGATEWNRILAYSQKGIGQGDGSAGAPFDISLDHDGWWVDGGTWYHEYTLYSNESTWTRTDVRLINLLDPTWPTEFQTQHLSPTTATHFLDRMVSSDARGHCTAEIGSGIWSCGDFRFHPTVIGDRGRGIWMMSPVSHQRFAGHARTATTRGQGVAPWILAAEADLLHAEALLMTGGSAAMAADLINTTRVGRGGLSAASAGNTTQQLLDMIHYERQIELHNTSGFTIYHHRVFGTLREGTLCHMPIPASELEILGAPIYTFGGPGAGAGSAGCNGIGPAAFVAGRSSVLLDIPTIPQSSRGRSSRF